MRGVIMECVNTDEWFLKGSKSAWYKRDLNDYQRPWEVLDEQRNSIAHYSTSNLALSHAYALATVDDLLT